MSKSVTVIGGKVWTQRSVTWNGNVVGGRGDGGHGGRHLEAEGDACAGEGPDDAPMMREWDSIQEGRNFTRRVKTT